MPEKEPESLSEEEELTAPSVEEVSETEEETTLVPSGITEERVSELLDDKLSAFTASQKELLEQLAEREVQSKHDRRYGRFETKLDEILSIKDRVDNNDGSWDEILATMERQQFADTSDAALDAKIKEALASHSPAPDKAEVNAQRKAEWNAEWKSAVQKVQDKATADGLSIPADAIEQVRSAEYKTYMDARDALSDLYIAVKTGAEIPAAAVQTEGGGVTPPVSEDETPPLDNSNDAMDNLQEAILTYGAGSREAKLAKGEADKVLAAAYGEHGITFVPTEVPKR